MQNGLYVISGEAFDEQDVVAGFRMFKKLKKKLRKIRNIAQKGLKFAAPALGVASFAMPMLAPATAATALASKVMSDAKKGHRPARAALRITAKKAERGDPDAQRFLSIAQRVQRAAPRTLMNAAQFRELAMRARQGNPQARRMLQYVAGRADAGDSAFQEMVSQAAGTARWDLVAGHELNQDLEIMGGCVPPSEPAAAGAEDFDIVSGGPVWDYFKPRRGMRASQEVWGPRDAYRLGLEAVPARRSR